MYGIRKDADFSFLVGRELTQLALGRYELQLIFEEQASISVQCTLRLRFQGATTNIRSDQPGETKELACVIGEKVSDVRIGEPGELSVAFANGCEIVLEDSNQNFESYVIWHKGNFIAI